MLADDLDREVINILTTRRVVAGMTQEELATAVTDLKIGVQWTRSQVAAIESGRRKGLRAAEIIALCIVHEVTFADLLRQAGVDKQHVATLTGRSVSAVVLSDDLDDLQRRVGAARRALDLDEPPPEPTP